MGAHAKPRAGVRSATMGALAAGAALTGIGLTAAAIDAGGPTLSDGPYTADPMNLAAAGLGAPVPVADTTALDVTTRVVPVSPAATTAPSTASTPATRAKPLKTAPSTAATTSAYSAPAQLPIAAGTAQAATPIPHATARHKQADGSPLGNLVSHLSPVGPIAQTTVTRTTAGIPSAQARSASLPQPSPAGSALSSLLTWLEGLL